MTIARLSLLALLGASMTTLAACGSSAEEPAVATISPPTFSAAYRGLSDEQANAVLFFDDRDLTTKSGSPTAQDEQARFFSGSGFAEDGLADTDTRGFRTTGEGLTGVGLTEANVQGVSTATLYSGSPKFGTGANGLTNALTPFHLSWSGGTTAGGPNINTAGAANSDVAPLFIAPGIVGLTDAGVIRVAKPGETPARTAGFTPLTQGQYLTGATRNAVDYRKDPRASVGEFGPSVANFADLPRARFGSGAPGGLAAYNLETRTIDGTSTYGWQGKPTGGDITRLTRDFDVDLIYPSVKDGDWKLQYSTFVLVRASLKGPDDVDPVSTRTDANAPDRFLNVFTFLRTRDFNDPDVNGTGSWRTTGGELGDLYTTERKTVEFEYQARLAAWGVVAKDGAEEVWLLFGKNPANELFKVTFNEGDEHDIAGKIEAYRQKVGSKAGVIPSSPGSVATRLGIIPFELAFRDKGLNALELAHDADNAETGPRDVIELDKITDYGGGNMIIRKGTFVGPVANEFIIEFVITPPDPGDNAQTLPTYLGAVIGQRNDGVPKLPVVPATTTP